MDKEKILEGIRYILKDRLEIIHDDSEDFFNDNERSNYQTCVHVLVYNDKFEQKQLLSTRDINIASIEFVE